jgi:hypothetical protein
MEYLVLGGDEEDGFGADFIEVLPHLGMDFVGGGGAFLEGVDDEATFQAGLAAGDGGDEDADPLGAGVDDGELPGREAEQVGEVAWGE